MVALTKELKLSERLLHPTPSTYFDIYKLGEEMTDRWVKLMQIEKYYVWATAQEQQEALAQQNEYEKIARMQIFGEE
jgi:hypothetical protein